MQNIYGLCDSRQIRHAGPPNFTVQAYTRGMQDRRTTKLHSVCLADNAMPLYFTSAPLPYMTQLSCMTLHAFMHAYTSSRSICKVVSQAQINGESNGHSLMGCRCLGETGAGKRRG